MRCACVCAMPAHARLGTERLWQHNGRGPESIGRLAIEGLACPSWQLGMDLQHAMDDALRAVLQIKALVRAAKCAACISIPAGAVLL